MSLPFANFSTLDDFKHVSARYKGLWQVGSVENIAFQKSDLAEKCRLISEQLTFDLTPIIATILGNKFFIYAQMRFFRHL